MCASAVSVSCLHLAAGSVEFLKKFTSIEDPFYVYDVELDHVTTGSMDAQGILYHAVDHLPSECPR